MGQPQTNSCVILTEVAPEFPSPINRQEENAARDVVVPGDVQLRQEQEELIRTTVFYDPAMEREIRFEYSPGI